MFKLLRNKALGFIVYWIYHNHVSLAEDHLQKNIKKWKEFLKLHKMKISTHKIKVSAMKGKYI
jgi:hypothetical protein